jgi:vacuolar-type H+-ATPase subunit F/Vma7
MEEMKKSYKIAVVGGHALELGFKISGITTSYTCETGPEAEAAVQKLMQDDQVGIIVLAANLAREIRDRKVREALTSSMKPLFIVVAEPGDKEEYEDNLRQLIIRALGVDIMKAKAQS